MTNATSLDLSASAITADIADAPAKARARWLAILPGVLLTAAIAGEAFTLRHLPGFGVFSPMILAIVIGIAFHNLIGTPVRAKGLRPLALGFAAFLFIAGFSLMLVKMSL